MDHLCKYDDADGDERNVVVLFHNFKGYDGMFLLQTIHAEHRMVDQQICQRVKALSFK